MTNYEYYLIFWILYFSPSLILQSVTNRYTSGIYKCTSPPRLDHAALVVGYTPTYWIVKNSWGPNWGNDGYVYIARGSGNVANCGIAEKASVPYIWNKFQFCSIELRFRCMNFHKTYLFISHLPKLSLISCEWKYGLEDHGLIKRRWL